MRFANLRLNSLAAEVYLMEPRSHRYLTEGNSQRLDPIMNIRVVVLISALVLTSPLFARTNTDVLVMKNGDRMTCQVKGLDAGVLYVSMVQSGPS